MASSSKGSRSSKRSTQNKSTKSAPKNASKPDPKKTKKEKKQVARFPINTVVWADSNPGDYPKWPALVVEYGEAEAGSAETDQKLSDKSDTKTPIKFFGWDDPWDNLENEVCYDFVGGYSAYSIPAKRYNKHLKKFDQAKGEAIYHICHRGTAEQKAKAEKSTVFPKCPEKEPSVPQNNDEDEEEEEDGKKEEGDDEDLSKSPPRKIARTREADEDKVTPQAKKTTTGK